ncbi:molybdopterin molybdotransferase MoeA [Lacrimispora sp.]|uniref:molybdopterin molybdotransferase MoeA n=1 Tax=Lacrimispora sp. TaxID=2719234 RepID=UPI002FD8C4E6
MTTERTGIELEEAVTLILDSLTEPERTELVPAMEANGRILAEDVYAPFDIPPFHRSPLDGFALRSEDLLGASVENPKSIRIIDTVYAGDWCRQKVGQGEGVRIMTGAAIPEGADCIIRLEDVEEGSCREKDAIQVDREMAHNQNFCFQGEDVAKGTPVLYKGIKLTYVEQGILSSLGMEEVKVYHTLKVALFSTGDELILPGTELSPGKIYDSNLFLLYARLCEFGIKPVIAKPLPDRTEDVVKAIRESCEAADLVITTGGVSAGDKDIFHEVLPALGAKRIFWKVNLKPGTPAMFSIYEGTPMFHLSGNPFAAATTFELLVRPFLAKAGRDEGLHINRIRAILDEDFTKGSKGRRFIRGRVKEGKVTIPPSGKHSSGMLASMSGCNCLIDIPAGSGELEKGSEVEVLLL